ncbi:MAG: 2-amino-4-hydroxy-6-hydroxymethyldihydropteridine diphosphokinase [Gemmatimonadota bacterium]
MRSRPATIWSGSTTSGRERKSTRLAVRLPPDRTFWTERVEWSLRHRAGGSTLFFEEFRPLNHVAIGLGSNLGDRFANLRFGWLSLLELLSEVAISHVYETSPLHFEDQPDFLNACCIGVAELRPGALLARMRRIERRAGRTVRGRRYGPRTLDLDLLLYGNECIRSPRLSLPHPRLLERAFVLVPLAEIAGSWSVPGTGSTVTEAAARIEATGIRQLDRIVSR